ncbi:MAG: VRR-NUC domain protein [Parcubacteria group bacterium ADurb.Bin216]|nr:MAG: VRR-NUC domain protein [Parcubacteria group bacterium ADurb.Bin216]
MLEKEIQKHIIDYLRYLGWFVIKNNTVGIYKKKTGKYIPSQAVGLADLTIIKDSRVIMLEVKTENGKQSDGQIEFQENWEKHGGEYYVVRSIQDVDNIISPTNKYKCNHCGAIVERESNKQWIKSYCENTDKDVHLIKQAPFN